MCVNETTTYGHLYAQVNNPTQVKSTNPKVASVRIDGRPLKKFHVRGLTPGQTVIQVIGTMSSGSQRTVNRYIKVNACPARNSGKTIKNKPVRPQLPSTKDKFKKAY